MNNVTLIGQVESVTGGIVSVRIRADMPSTLLMVEGASYRVGQIGAFVRISMGYTQLYAVCTQVGAAATPANATHDTSSRWISVTLFGEALGTHFERGISQYPTIGDEVHLAVARDLELIYSKTQSDSTIDIGTIAAANGIPARVDLGKLVTRHSAIVGSTGSGKSNTVAVILTQISDAALSSARVLVVDPHGEYSPVIESRGYSFKANPEKSDKYLYVPYWALPFDELRAIGFGELPPGKDAIIRDQITSMKRAAAAHLPSPPPTESITADSPIPFSINKLWFDLDDFERRTFQKTGASDICQLIKQGDAATLSPNIYPTHSPHNTAPYRNPHARGIERQLELLHSRLTDARYAFLFNNSTPWSPDLNGKTKADLDELIASWIGHDRPLTVLDVSSLPSDTLGLVVGTLIRLVWECVYWSSTLPIGGREQPLLIVLEEAHLFLPEGGHGPAHRTVARIAKEGRKYGVGLQVVTQRPSEIDSSILSQCGTMVALRLTNKSDREKVASLIPDDLGNLAALLPALRTGEGLIMGEAVPVPSRVRFRQAASRPRSDDPQMPSGWQKNRPDKTQYKQAISNWRSLKQ